jgi:hypothetical protein
VVDARQQLRERERVGGEVEVGVAAATRLRALTRAFGPSTVTAKVPASAIVMS